MLKATTMTGSGHTVEAVPIDETVEIRKRHRANGAPAVGSWTGPGTATARVFFVPLRRRFFIFRDGALIMLS